MIAEIQLLNDVWNKHAEQTLHPLAGSRIFCEFTKAGFTPDDLRVVLVWIKWKNFKYERKRDLNLRLVLDPYRDKSKGLGEPFEGFAIDLSEARAWERNLIQKKTARDRVLEQSGREAERVETKPRHIGEIFAAIKPTNQTQ